MIFYIFLKIILKYLINNLLIMPKDIRHSKHISPKYPPYFDHSFIDYAAGI